MELLKDYKAATEYLNNNLVGIVPTDTIYGISCKAMHTQCVEQIYSIKKRESSKPFIILISSIDDLKLFEVQLSKTMQEKLKNYWPGPVSVIFDVTSNHFSYLHRGTYSLAFRLPNKEPLLDMLRKTGPLVSTSANIAGTEPIKTYEEAREVFNQKVSFFLDEGQLNNPPSKIIRIDGESINIIRG